MSQTTTDHPREALRYFRLGFRDWLRAQINGLMMHEVRSVPDHLAVWHETGRQEAVAAYPDGAPYWYRRGLCFGGAIMRLNEQVPTHWKAQYSEGWQAGRTALRVATDRMRERLGMPPEASVMPAGPPDFVCRR